ncbi:MAG: lysophospholipid acyltransferase family protein [Pseudomonadota bacterium]
MKWTGLPDGDIAQVNGMGWVRVICKGLPLGSFILVCLALLLLIRLVERPIFGLHRPVTPYITQGVCRVGLWWIGIRYSVIGTPMKERGAVVANHASWLDIFALNTSQRVYFVSKAEVSNWPFIGWLARATGTMFIKRERADAVNQRQRMEKRLLAGHRLLFFPEGSSSDGLRILPFKSTLFAAFFTSKIYEECYVQPATVNYHAPTGEAAQFYGWWGDMEFGPHLLQTLAARHQGRVEVVFHSPLKLSDFPDRKALARAAEDAVKAGLTVTGLSAT